MNLQIIILYPCASDGNSLNKLNLGRLGVMANTARLLQNENLHLDLVLTKCSLDEFLCRRELWSPGDLPAG